MYSITDYGLRDGFFSRISTWDYFDNLRSKIKSEVESLSDSDILSQDIQDLTQYFLDKYTCSEVKFSHHEQQRDTKKRITRYFISHI